MSDSTTLTRCPHCQTRFRVTEQQLGVASGKVRCGNCMEVFNARENAVPPTPAPSAAPAKPAPEPARPAPAEPEEDDEFLFQDNPEEDATDARYTQSLQSDDEFSDSFLALDQGGRFEDDQDEAEESNEVDESWAEEILHDDAHLETRTRQEQPAQPNSQPDRQTEREPSPARPSPTPLKPRKPEQPLKAPPREPVHRDPAEELSLSVEPDDIRYPGSEPAGNRAKKTKPAPGPATTPKQTPYADLRSAPIPAGKRGRGWGMTLLWALGCLLLIGFVASQLFYFQFDRLSRYEALRPIYAAVCPLVGCELPQMVDTDQIESRKLVVRSHPDEPRALLVEALIVNQAPFPQPFPAIVLTFSNLNNDIVAQRAFKPDEYLAGDARNLTRMPEGTPIKIALELRDPGQDAVNYSVRFLPAPKEG